MRRVAVCRLFARAAASVRCTASATPRPSGRAPNAGARRRCSASSSARSAGSCEHRARERDRRRARRRTPGPRRRPRGWRGCPTRRRRRRARSPRGSRATARPTPTSAGRRSPRRAARAPRLRGSQPVTGMPAARSGASSPAPPPPIQRDARDGREGGEDARGRGRPALRGDPAHRDRRRLGAVGGALGRAVVELGDAVADDRDPRRAQAVARRLGLGLRDGADERARRATSASAARTRAAAARRARAAKRSRAACR